MANEFVFWVALIGWSLRLVVARLVAIEFDGFS